MYGAATATLGSLDRTFAALAHPARRAILSRLAQGGASAGELGAPLAMSQPAVSRHLKVLEEAGLITRGRNAQWRPCELRTESLQGADRWLGTFRMMWEDRLDRLDAHLRHAHPTDRHAGEPDHDDKAVGHG
jgi:DNA-binding transcriptional ArsR family regulator